MALAAGTVLDLAGCSPMHVVSEEAIGNRLRIPLSEFGESNALIVRTKAAAYDILVVRYADQTTGALLMECTHQNTPLNATGTGLFCPAHGSAFDLQGNVTRGPAAKPLKIFNTSIEDGIVIVHLT
jgi:Rieske Fe-S protein